MERNLSSSLEDYLETILLLSEAGGQVRVTDIAEKLDVAKSSVHTAVKNLGSRGYVVHERYGTLCLTAEGRRLAAEVYARHRDLKIFFEQVLGVSPQTAEQDACAIEHVVSDEALARISEITASYRLEKRDKNL